MALRTDAATFASWPAQRANVMQAIDSLQIVFSNAGVCCRLPGGSSGNSAQVNDAFCEQVTTFFYSLRDVVEQLVELHKLRPLEVPVGMLGLISLW
jgi:hypothetical protein